MIFNPGDEIDLRPGDWVDTFHLRRIIIGPSDESDWEDGPSWMIPGPELIKNCYRVGYSMEDPNSYNIYHKKWLRPAGFENKRKEAKRYGFIL